MLSMATIALVQTIVSIIFRNKPKACYFSKSYCFYYLTLALQIENNLDEWVTGEHVDVPFTTMAYKAKYCAHLKRITDFEKKTREADIIPRLLKHMLKAARYVYCKPVPNAVLIFSI